MDTVVVTLAGEAIMVRKKKMLVKGKMKKVMGEYKRGKLRSGKPGPGKGPKVKSQKQALAIAFSEARKAKMSAPKNRSR